MADTFQAFNQKATGVINHFKNDLHSLRTGKASTQMLDTLKVEAYGTYLSLQEVATVSLVDTQLLMVKPYDKQIIDAIQRAITLSDLPFQPVVDGEVVKIPVPPLTQERRQEMVKLLHQKLEAAKVMLRTVRTDVKQDIEDQKGSEGISEDDIHADLDQLEKQTQEFMQKLEMLAKEKEAELLQV